MIKYEFLTINNKDFVKTFSDEGKYIQQVETGIKYSEAIDILPSKYTYIETNEPIEVVDYGNQNYNE